jgi:ATP-binding cassette, subfamily B, bacterial PglK
MLASGGAELVSLGAVLPFLAVLSDPERLWQQPLVQALAGRVGFTEASELLLPATLVFAVAAVLAAVVRLANLWLNGRLADQRRVAVGSDLSCEAYRRTLVQPYGVHVQRNSAAVMAPGLLPGLLLIDWAVALEAVLPFLAVLSASTPTEQEADGRGFPLSRQVRQPGGGVVPPIPCSA